MNRCLLFRTLTGLKFSVTKNTEFSSFVRTISSLNITFHSIVRTLFKIEEPWVVSRFFFFIQSYKANSTIGVQTISFTSIFELYICIYCRLEILFLLFLSFSENRFPSFSEIAEYLYNVTVDETLFIFSVWSENKNRRLKVGNI